MDASPDPALGDGRVTDIGSSRSKPAMRALNAALATSSVEPGLDDLVDAARRGEPHAFEELVRRTSADTYTLARRLVSDEHEASDVVQEAYLRAFRALGSFRGDAQFTTWLYRITANCASTHLRRRRRHHHEPLDDTIDVIDHRPEHDPTVATDASMLREQLETAIAQLPPRLRAVVVLRDVYDLSHADIAQQLGISESAAKVRLHRARRRLRTDVFPLVGERARPDVAAEERSHAS